MLLFRHAGAWREEGLELLIEPLRALDREHVRATVEAVGALIAAGEKREV